MANRLSRRSFLNNTAKAAAAFSIVPSHVMGGALGYKSPSDKLNIAVVGPGGRGTSIIEHVRGTENIVALCDVDWKKAKPQFDQFPNAKRYWDFRKMFDEMRNGIDAVIVATPDHTHCIVAAQAITMGKHVYCEKPLTHSVYESRLLSKLAAYHKVATQMGNQGSSEAGVRQICDWIADGQIGEVRKVECSTNRPIWAQGLNPPKEVQAIPDTLNWDLFIGPAQMIPYNAAYHPWNWRGWWAFGTGALGDMACHIMHPVFKALKLGYPTKVQGSSSVLLADCAPVAQKVKMTFPARTKFDTTKVAYPEVDVTWTDGGILQDYPKGWPANKHWDGEGPVIFHGTKDSIICGCYGRDPWLMSGRSPKSPKTQREIPEPQGNVKAAHAMDWVRACKENPKTRVETASHFGEAGPFNEMVVMGVLAVRLQGLGKELLWDGNKMEFTNIRDNEEIKWITSTSGRIRNRTEPMNAKATAQELIKHTYREGWQLPEMPR